MRRCRCAQSVKIVAALQGADDTPRATRASQCDRLVGEPSETFGLQRKWAEGISFVRVESSRYQNKLRRKFKRCRQEFFEVERAKFGLPGTGM